MLTTLTPIREDLRRKRETGTIAASWLMILRITRNTNRKNIANRGVHIMPAGFRTRGLLIMLAVLVLGACSRNLEKAYLIDLTHPIPTFEAMEGDPLKPDLSRPHLHSKPIPTFGQQTVFSLGRFATNQGHFDLGTLVLSEHHGTHIDTPGHFINNAVTQDPENPPGDERKLTHTLLAEDLVGPIVMIDISARVQAELDKNGGGPSPDIAITNFSDASGNVVTAADIAAVEDRIEDGVWIVLNQGWGRFFNQGADFATDPYINGWNFPGLRPDAVEKIIEIEDRKNVRINGIVSDVIGVETGENSLGKDGKWIDSWYAHVHGLQRGWKFVENANNLGQLALVDAGRRCLLIIGAPKHIRGTGGPSRVVALCPKPPDTRIDAFM